MIRLVILFAITICIGFVCSFWLCCLFNFCSSGKVNGFWLFTSSSDSDNIGTEFDLSDITSDFRLLLLFPSELSFYFLCLHRAVWISSWRLKINSSLFIMFWRFGKYMLLFMTNFVLSELSFLMSVDSTLSVDLVDKVASEFCS